MYKPFTRTATLIILIALVSACGPAAPTPTPAATAVLVATATSPTATPVPPTATPAPTTRTPAPTATPLPTPLAPLDGRGGGVIAFTSERDGNADIYVMNADSTGERRLTADPAYDGWPAWSPDGSRIAFMSTRSGNPDIYVMDADGAEQGSGNVRQLTTDPADDIWPEWSPDGTRIAFPSRRDGNLEIYVIDADGTNLQRLTDTPAAEDFPAWSPDGAQIVYARIEGEDGTYIINADGSDPRKLTDIVGLEFAWSPDGTRIAFGSDYAGFRGLYVLDVSGAEPGSGNLHKLSNTRAGENCPTWSPDGTRLAFASWDDGDGEIYVMNADGATEGSRNLQKLTDNSFEDEFPAWRPDPLFSGDGRTGFITRIYGGPYSDRVSDILLLADGGTLIAGQANSEGLSHRIPPGNARLIRTDAGGNIVWEKDYGGEVDAAFCSLVQVEEDAYVALGQIAASYERDETDFYLVKVDGEGNEIWSHTYGGRGMDIAEMVRQTADGGLILVGDRADEFPTDYYVYESNIVLIKTDAEGNEVWTRTYGDEILYLGWGVVQTPDGGYVLTGWEAKTIDDRDVIVIKTTATGDVEWSRTWELSPGERDGGFDMILTADGPVVIAGIRSMDSGPRGAVLIKVDLEGNEVWARDFTEGQGNEFWDIMEDTDGGYVMAGAALLGKNPATGEDIRRGLIIKTDPDGEMLWQYVFDGDEYELTHFSSAVVLPDGGYIFVGQAIRKVETYLDMLWLKLTPAGTTPPTDTAVLPTGTNTPTRAAISVDTADQVELLSTLSGHNDKVNDLALAVLVIRWLWRCSS